MADLNVPRVSASSICHGNYIYLFCGENNFDLYFNSFERISLTGLQSGSESWELMPIPSEDILPKVVSPVVVSYNDKEIALIKGDKKEGTYNYAAHDW